MSFTVQDPIAAGTIYPVTDVAGHPPVSISDFVGSVEFHVSSNGAQILVSGTGVSGSTRVLRFYESSAGGSARIWDVSAGPGAGIVAYPVAGR